MTAKSGRQPQLICRVDRIVNPLVEMSAEGGGKVRTGREAQDTNPVCINVPLGGVGAYDPEGALLRLGAERMTLGKGRARGPGI